MVKRSRVQLQERIRVILHNSDIICGDSALRAGSGAGDASSAGGEGSTAASQHGGGPLLCRCGCPSPAPTEEVSALRGSPLIAAILGGTAALDPLLQHHSLDVL